MATLPLPLIGGIVHAADINYLLGGSASRKPSFRLHLNTGQSFTTGTFAIVKWDTVDEDTDSGYSASTGLYTVGTSGLWLLTCRTQWTNAGTAATPRVIEFQQNGGDVGDHCTLGSADTLSEGRTVASVIVRCTQGDTLGLWAVQTSTATLTFGGSGTPAAFSGAWLGA